MVHYYNELKKGYLEELEKASDKEYAKYLPDVNFSVNQKAITNSVKNTGVANVVALEDIKDVNENVILGVNSSFQIVTVEKLTVDNLMSLIIQ